MQANVYEHLKTLNLLSGAESRPKAEIIWWSPFSEISRKAEIKNLKNRERKKNSKLFFANLSFRNHKSKKRKNQKLGFLRVRVCVKSEKQGYISRYVML